MGRLLLVSAFLVPALVQAAAPAKPDWLVNLPQQPGRIYGLGVAPVANTMALAVRQASDGARAEVLARLRANVNSDTQVGTKFQQDDSTAGKRPKATTASRSITARTDVRIQTQATDLPGLTVGATYFDENDASPTLYALAYLDVAVADQELRARYDTLAGSLAADRGDGGGRAIFHRIQVLKTALVELAKLDDLSSLIRVAGGDPTLRESILKSRQEAERERAALRPKVTFGIAPNPDLAVDEDVLGAVRTAILKEGMGWNDKDPLFTLAMRVKSGRNGVETGRRAWWEYSRSPDFIMAQGTISLTLTDRAGQAFESTLIVAKGVGVTEFQAETLLLQDYKNKLTKAVSLWLAEMGQ